MNEVIENLNKEINNIKSRIQSKKSNLEKLEVEIMQLEQDRDGEKYSLVYEENRLKEYIRAKELLENSKEN